MSDMPPGTHVKHRTGTPGLGAAWAILAGMGATSVTYNVVHAVHGGALNIFLALVYGIAPVYGAALLSHVVAVHGGGRLMQAVTFALMLGAMGLSIGATAAVVRPVAGAWMQWLFGIVTDGAALVALRVILASRHRKAAAAAAVDAALAEAKAALERAGEAAGEQSRLEAELTAANAALETVRAELGAEVQALTSALNKARNKARTSGQKRRAASPRNNGSGSPLNVDVPSDVDTQAEALRILGEEPGISGGELGLRLGKSKRYGCILKNKLAASVAGPDTAEQP